MSTYEAIIVELASNSEGTQSFAHRDPSNYKFPKTTSHSEVASELMLVLFAAIVEVSFIFPTSQYATPFPS